MTTRSRIAVCVAFLACATLVIGAETAHPIKVSENGRYFVDQKGQPFFWLGTTQWQLFRGYSREDARTIVEKTREKGFSVAQVMLTGD